MSSEADLDARTGATERGDVVPLREPRVAEPPNNTEVEAALLGAILTNNRSYGRVADILSPEHFYAEAHRLIYAACADFIDNGKTASPITIKSAVGRSEAVIEAGGDNYLYELAASVLTTLNTREYANTIIDHWRDREGMALCQEATEAFLDRPYGTASTDMVEGLIDRLSRLVEDENRSAGARSFTDVADDTLQEIDRDRRGEAVPGVLTGLLDMDRLLEPMSPGDLIILAGRPSMGKSAMAGNIAYNVAKAGRGVYFASLEMSNQHLMRRQFGSITNIDTKRMNGRRARDLTQSEFEKLQSAARQHKGLPLYFDDRSSLTVSALTARAKATDRKVRRQGRDAEGNDGPGLALIVVDYLQLMMADAETRRMNNQVQNVSALSRGLKSLALNMGVAVLALSQLSRQVESRENKRPQLADLRESGSIEQDADAVLMMYREEYYLEKDKAAIPANDLTKWNEFESRMEGCKGIAEVGIMKQRRGATGTVEVRWDAEHQRFENLSREDER